MPTLIPITKHLIEEGRSHLLEGQPFDPGCPVRILQGMRDPDVPWRFHWRWSIFWPAPMSS